LVERERLRVPVRTEDAYNTFYASEEVNRLFDELVAEKLSVSQILLLLEHSPLSTGEISEKLGMSPAEIGLSVRTTNCLEDRGIFTVEDLLHCTREDLLSISNFGEKTLEEVYKALEDVGFYRKAQREVPADSPGAIRQPR